MRNKAMELDSYMLFYKHTFVSNACLKLKWPSERQIIPCTEMFFTFGLAPILPLVVLQEHW